MNVASLELAHELHLWSGWETETKFGHPDSGLIAPNYDLGYLLRKLPNDKSYRTDMARTNGNWAAYLWGPSKFAALGSKNFQVIARGVSESPEDAAAMLAIELFKQGILTNEVV